MKLNTKARPIERQKNPHDWEAYRKAALWLRDNDPIEVIDRQPEETEKIIREFGNVYFNYTDPKDFHGYYSPGGWALDAAFAFGFQMGKQESEKGRTA